MQVPKTNVTIQRSNLHRLRYGFARARARKKITPEAVVPIIYLGNLGSQSYQSHLIIKREIDEQVKQPHRQAAHIQIPLIASPIDG